MERERGAVQLFGLKAREKGGSKRRCVSRMMGAAERRLEARHVAEIVEFGEGRESVEELREALAIFKQNRRAWRRLAREQRGGRIEAFRSEQAPAHGKARAERLDQAEDDIVAIDGEAALGQSVGRRQRGIEKSRSEARVIESLSAHGLRASCRLSS